MPFAPRATRLLGAKLPPEAPWWGPRSMTPRYWFSSPWLFWR
jgi:hypothetical protein